MLTQIDKARDKLIQAGIAPGERIAVLSEPSVGFFVLTLACWKIGAVVVPLSTRYPVDRVNAVLKHVNCRRVFAGAASGLNRPDAEICRTGDFAAGETTQTSPVALEELGLDLDADASIIFTSGSTGMPRGVLHTIAGHYYSALGSHENIPFGPGHAWLASLPMYHVSGFSLIMRALVAGGTIIFPRPGESLADAVMHPGVTHLSAVPTQLKRLLEKSSCVERLRKLNAILVGGSAVPRGLMERAVSAGLPVCTTYGSTEAASQIATGRPGETGGVKVLPYRKVRIAADGEILLKGKTLFRGYVHGDSVEPAVDAEGFFHTADTGSLDDDGNLCVTGRKDLMFICGGENVHPEEIERALMNLPDIEQAVVVPVDDPEFGQSPAAFIKTTDNLPLDREKIETSLRRTLEPFKIPKTFHPWPESVPDSLKAQRKNLRRIAEGQS